MMLQAGSVSKNFKLPWKKGFKGILFVPFILLLLLSVLTATQTTDKIAPIVLLSESMPVTPKEFYLADVIDERSDRKAVASLLPVTNTTQFAVAQQVDLKGGTIVALRQYFRQSLPQNKKLRPIVVKIKELKVSENPGAKGIVEGRITVNLDFDLVRDGENVNLIQYKGGAKYNRSASQHNVVEPALRQSLVSAVKYLNTWIDREADINEKLAKGIKVYIEDFTEVNADTVFYDAKRPLAWNDFRGRSSKPGNYAAAVFPSFGYESRFEVVKGIIHIHLTMKVFVVKDYSWVKDAAREAYSLNHEQRHFDIVKLIAERYKQKVKAENLTVADYNSIMQYHYIESFREMNKMQEQYDSETRHGLNQAVQQAWNQRIDDELRVFNAKK